MSQVAKKNEQTLTADVCGKTLSFRIGRADYNKYINSINPKDKVAPSHNFLIQTVEAESLEELKKILEQNAGSEVELASALLEEYIPDLGLVVKKSSSAQSE